MLVEVYVAERVDWEIGGVEWITGMGELVPVVWLEAYCLATGTCILSCASIAHLAWFYSITSVLVAVAVAVRSSCMSHPG